MFGGPELIKNIHKQVAERIGRSVVRGDVSPGEVLPSEVKLCEMMSVSRTAVREALRILHGKGLIEPRAKSGTRVRNPQEWNQFDPDILRWQFDSAELTSYLVKLFRLRTAVEPMAAEYAAMAATPEDLAKIRAAADAMSVAESNEAWVTADIDLHRSIHIATRNEFFWPIAQIFETALRRSFALAAPGDHRPRAIIEHRAVMEAICAREPKRAHRTMTDLIAHAADDLKRMHGIDPLADTERIDPVR